MSLVVLLNIKNCSGLNHFCWIQRHFQDLVIFPVSDLSGGYCNAGKYTEQGV